VPRWKNVSEPRDWVFATTTVVGWVPVFADPRVADTISAAILFDCRHEGAKVHAFVVMPEHIHAIITLPENLDASQAFNRLKGAWANRILDVVSHGDLLRLKRAKEESKERSVWMRGFVGKTLDKEFFFLQKADYIHNNPVRRGLCEKALDYVWSTARHWHYGLRNDDGVIISDEDIARLGPCAVRDPLPEVVKRVMRRRNEN